jgi:hypothetical protein
MCHRAISWNEIWSLSQVTNPPDKGVVCHIRVNFAKIHSLSAKNTQFGSSSILLPWIWLKTPKSCTVSAIWWNLGLVTALQAGWQNKKFHQAHHSHKWVTDWFKLYSIRLKDYHCLQDPGPSGSEASSYQKLIHGLHIPGGNILSVLSNLPPYQKYIVPHCKISLLGTATGWIGEYLSGWCRVSRWQILHVIGAIICLEPFLWELQMTLHWNIIHTFSQKVLIQNPWI